MKILHISHNDLDGMTPTWISMLTLQIAKERLSTELDIDLTTHNIRNPASLMNELTPIFNHQQRPEDDSLTEGLYDEYDLVFISDLTVDAPIFLRILEYGLDKFYVADHHPILYDPYASAQTFPQYKDWTVNDLVRHICIHNYLPTAETEAEKHACGTHLFLYNIWLPFLEKELPEVFEVTKNILMGPNMRTFVEAVRLWDTFDWQDQSEGDLLRNAAIRTNSLFKGYGNKIVHDYFLDYILEEEDWTVLGYTLTEDTAGGHIGITELINMELDRIESEKAGVAKAYQSFTWEIDTLNMHETLIAGLFLSPNKGMISTCANHLLDIDPTLDIVAGVTGGIVSLRSRRGSDVDCGKIAREFGGGGHENAAGFAPVDNDVKWMQRNYFLGLAKLASEVTGKL